jgi:hypothetical protein
MWESKCKFWNEVHLFCVGMKEFYAMRNIAKLLCSGTVNIWINGFLGLTIIWYSEEHWRTQRFGNWMCPS